MTTRLRGLGEPIRSYPLALADQLARCKPGDLKLKLLNDLYCRMTPAHQLAVRGELHRIRTAKRGESLAVLV